VAIVRWPRIVLRKFDYNFDAKRGLPSGACGRTRSVSAAEEAILVEGHNRDEG
jgi:hypothetical protein